MAKFKVGEIVKIRGERSGSINEYARIDQVLSGDRYWVVNTNMPFSGSICEPMDESELIKTASELRKEKLEVSYTEDFLHGY
jgi:hypothetical protein